MQLQAESGETTKAPTETPAASEKAPEAEEGDDQDDDDRDGDGRPYPAKAAKTYAACLQRSIFHRSISLRCDFSTSLCTHRHNRLRQMPREICPFILKLRLQLRHCGQMRERQRSR